MWAAIVAVFQNVGALIAIIRAGLSLIRELKALADEQRAREANEKNEARKKAMDDLTNAQTEEEFDRAHDSVVANRP